MFQGKDISFFLMTGVCLTIGTNTALLHGAHQTVIYKTEHYIFELSQSVRNFLQERFQSIFTAGGRHFHWQDYQCRGVGPPERRRHVYSSLVTNACCFPFARQWVPYVHGLLHYSSLIVRHILCFVTIP